MINRNILLYVEELDGTIEATLITYLQWLQWRLREQAREPKPLIDDDMHLINLNASLIPLVDHSLLDYEINVELIERPLVPRKQLAAYSHKPKGVKRLFKPQNR